VLPHFASLGSIFHIVLWQAPFDRQWLRFAGKSAVLTPEHSTFSLLACGKVDKSVAEDGFGSGVERYHHLLASLTKERLESLGISGGRDATHK